MTDLGELSVALVTCPRCAAPPGKPCSTSSGNRLSHGSHSGRTRAVTEGWRVGFDEGLRFAMDHPDSTARMLARRDEENQ